MRNSALHRRVLLKLGGTGIFGGALITSSVSAEEANSGEVTELTGFGTPQPITDGSNRFQLITPANRLTIDHETDDPIDLVLEWDDSITVDSGGFSVSGAIPLSDDDDEDIGEQRAIFRVAEPEDQLVYDRLTLRELDTIDVEPGDEIEVTVSARQADSPEDTDDFDDVVAAVDDDSFEAEATTEAIFEVTQGTLISANETATTDLDLSEDVDHTIGFDIDRLRDEDADGTPAGPAKGIIINYFLDDDDGLEFNLADDDVTLGTAAANLDLEVVKSREIPGVGQVLLEITNDETLEDNADLEVGDTVTVELSGLDTAAVDPDEFDNNSTVEVGLHGAATFDPIVSELITPDRGAYTIDSVNFEFGDQTGPTKIEDWHDLDEVRNDLSGDYMLVADLDEDTEGYDEIVADPEFGFNPIDNTSAEVFTGNFDGNGHEISNLRINRPDQDNIGVFGVIDDGAVIENVGLTNVTVIGGNTVGGLVGTNSYGDETISNSYVTGEVTGKTDVGGLVGSIGIGTIEDSYSTADVTGETQVGGLAGFTEDNVVSDSYATGTVTADNRRVGGLIGFTGSTDVSMCYATGDVNAEGADEVGGLVGESSGTISESYATGTVTGGNSVGGFVGDHFGEINTSFADATVEATDDNAQIGGLVGHIRSGETITQSYALGSVDAENASSLGGFVGKSNGDISQSYAAVVVQGTGSNIGGFIGESEGSLPEDSYWDTEVSGQGDSSGAEGVQTAELVGDSATDTMTGLDFDSIWETVGADDPAATDDGYPILQAIDSQPQLDAQGIADSPDPDPANFNVEIANPADGEEVTEDESLDVDVDVTNVSGEEAEKTVALTDPIESEKDLQLGADETENVTFDIPGDEVDGEVTITVESPDDTDQITVTAVDPCFIATAAYDTPAAQEIEVLRDFRDEVLRQHALGRLFIKTYYRTSPPIAQWIRRNRTRRELVKQYFVEPLINIVQTRSSIWKRE